MKSQALYSLKDKSKKLECHLLQFLYGTLKVKISLILYAKMMHFLQKNKRNLSSTYFLSKKYMY